MRSTTKNTPTARRRTIPNNFSQTGVFVVSRGPSGPEPVTLNGPRTADLADASSRSGSYETIRILSIQCVWKVFTTYTALVPKLWTDTIETHRREVRDATLDTAAALVTKHGLLSVTMSQIAEETGIGRATLYKYFADVEAILVAWHERQVNRHLVELTRIRDQARDAGERLETVLEAYALIAQEHHGTELSELLHRGKHAARAQGHLNDLIRDLLTEGVAAGDVRNDVAPEELASYCVHALAAASSLPSKAAVRRLVAVTMAGLNRSKTPMV